MYFFFNFVVVFEVIFFVDIYRYYIFGCLVQYNNVVDIVDGNFVWIGI